ncbi:MAG: TIGR03013 family XrtA/PEP-CTERM system glycosyltransferase [Sedimenticola sp.]
MSKVAYDAYEALAVGRKSDYSNCNTQKRINFLKGRVKVFGHYIHSLFMLLALVELGLVVGSGYTVGTLFPTLSSGSATLEWVVPVSAFNGLTIILSMMAMGLYHARQRGRFVGVLMRVLTAFVVASLFISLLALIYPAFHFYDPAIFVIYMSSLVMASLAIRGIFHAYVDGYLFKRNVLVIGVGNKASNLKQLRRKSDQRGFSIKGFVRTDSAADVSIDASQVVTLDEMGICQYALARGIDEIVIALEDKDDAGLPEEELLNCRMNGIEVTRLLDFFEREVGKIAIDLVNSSWFIHSDGFRLDYLRAFSKRSFDVIASSMLLMAFLPIVIVAALAIWIENGFKGPILYYQSRIGEGGKRFNVIKFRSMVTDAEKNGAQWAVKNDSRVTKVGGFLRKYRVDEIPQLWNVLSGDMSLVGPRPERPEFVYELEMSIPYYNERHRVKPGVTGWAQSCYPYGASHQDSINKHEFDLFYVKNHSFLLDVSILLQTVEVVLFGKGGR